MYKLEKNNKEVKIDKVYKECMDALKINTASGIATIIGISALSLGIGDTWNNDIRLLNDILFSVGSCLTGYGVIGSCISGSVVDECKEEIEKRR